MIRPRGRPPMPSATSSAIDPVGITSIGARVSSPRRMTAPLPCCRTLSTVRRNGRATGLAGWACTDHPVVGGERGVGDEEVSFDAFVRARLPALLRFAHAVCGDPHTAADLVQDALERTGVHWSRLD